MEESKQNLIPKFELDRTYGFWDIEVLVVVFANNLIKLMSNIGKMSSLILIFANILPIFHE